MLIAENHVSEYSIILPVNPSITEKTAGKELKNYLFEITGAMLPIYRDDKAAGEKEIVIGYTNRGGYTEENKKELGDEGFIIKSEGEKIFIIAMGKRGVLYGVYTFLEEYCGCRFYTNDFEKVPELDSLEIPAIAENKQVPSFIYRNPYWYSVSEPGISVKLKINGEHGRWADEGRAIPEAFGGSEVYTGGFCHTITTLNESNDYWHQPCYNDEVVYQRVLKNVKKLLAENPDAKILSITQTDGNEGACKCDKCRAINEAEGSESATNVLFVNRIAEELEKDYPNVLFDTFAYRFTKYPPKTVRPRKNVQIRLCTIENCFRHPLDYENDPYGVSDKGVRTTQCFEDWGAISESLAVWNYDTNYTNCPVMFPNWEALLGDVKYFKAHKVISVFEQGTLASANGEFGELKGYIVARILWDPDMSETKYWGLIKEFCDDFYGEGGKYIYEFINLQLDCSKDSHFGVYFDNPCNNIFMPGIEDHQAACHAFADKATELFDKAELATKDSPFQYANVRRSRIQLFDYIDFMLRADRDLTDDEAEKARLSDEIYANNTNRFNFIKTYDAFTNREFRDLDEASEVDLTDYALRW